jgi:endonuclease/exonuclease/phosphatase (EEP) superfamily protein YafD
MALKRILPRLVPPPESLLWMGAPSREALPPAFSLLVWNVFKGKRAAWLRDLRRLAEHADLVLLQEAVLHNSSRDFFHTSLRHQWIMAQSFASERGEHTTGVKTGAVAAAADTLVFLSPHREPLVNTPKLILVTRYPVAGGAEPLLTVNVHALNFASTARFGMQMEQFVAAVEGHRGPVLLGGDFNTWNRSRRDVLNRLIAKLGLVPVPFGTPGRLRHLRRVLDHVFLRGIKVVAARAMEEVRSSDHLPLELRLEILAGPSAHHAASGTNPLQE